MYNQNNIEVGKIGFMNEEWNGTINTYPRLRLRSYSDDKMITEVSISNGYMDMYHELRGEYYQCILSPSNGLSFSKNGISTKSYSAQ